MSLVAQVEADREAVSSSSVSFSDIVPSPAIQAGLQTLGFNTPTPIQAEVIPHALRGVDIIAQAKTGSGKTFAFVIPLLCMLEGMKDQRGTCAIIITPTRELANQITDVFASLSPEVKPACLIGGESIGGQIRELKRDNRVVIGTPGRILDLIRQRQLILRKCRYFVLDEADEMLSMGFIDDVREILSRLPPERQGLFVSATISPRVESLIGSFLRSPVRVQVDDAKVDLPPIEHFYVELSGEVSAKTQALAKVLEQMKPRSAIVFCNTKSDTELVEVVLKRRGFNAEKINSDLPQKQRSKIMERMRADEIQILVGTDIAARGIDIEQIEMVVNYAIPEESEVYVHRTGRTGRAGRKGTAVSLVGPQDFRAFHDLKRFLQVELKKLVLVSPQQSPQ